MALIRKQTKYAENIKTLESHVHIIENNSEAIVEQWITHRDVEKILKLHNIERKDFREIYASGIISYFIQIVYKKVPIGDCPAIEKFLQFCSDKEIQSSELYQLCMHFRKALIHKLITLEVMSPDLYDQITHVLDTNFTAILNTYETSVFEVQQAIREHKQIFDQYNTALDQSALVSKTDENGLITYVNENFINVSAYNEEELLGHSHNIIRHPDMSAAFFKNMWKEILSGKVFRAIIKNKKKDGSDYYVDTTILPLYDLTHNIKEFLSVRYEVTELIKVRDMAIQAEKSKDIFLANMSHEIRTPLNAIIGFVDVLRKQIHHKEHRSYLDTINSSGQALLSIISDILDFAKLRNGNFDINKNEFDLLKELLIVINLFSQNAENKAIKYNYSLDSKLPRFVIADSVRINQILSNFLSNAIKFTPEKGEIKISIHVENSNLILSVTDSGKGMNQEQQSRIFTAFEQAEKTTTQEHGGTGLGLAISLKLAEYMEGNINLLSAPDEGSTFTLTLPLEFDKSTLQDLSLKTDSTLIEREDEEEIQFKGNVLVAEDNRANQMLIKLLLEDYDIRVTITNNGQEAYTMYEKSLEEPSPHYQLILMDNQMPVLNGIESTTKIRELEKVINVKRIPIVALTANALKGDREHFLENGMDDYLKKPIDFKELFRVLERYLIRQ